jgi:two-component system nitrogen regulation sensor histidine kinase GlnL
MKQAYTFMTDSGLRINSWSKEIAEITGKPSSAVLGKKYHDVLPRISTEDTDAVLTAIKGRKMLAFEEYNFNCLSGRIVAAIRINPIKAVNGKITGAEVAISPISTCSVVEKLQSSERFINIGRMASTLAHGVRNPLNAIKGAVVYLREKYAAEATLVEFTNIMEVEISRLDGFISRFLSASVSDLVSKELVSETDINSVLKKIEILTSLQSHAHNIEGVYNYGNVPSVLISPFRIEQAILNVINNAIEAMPSGGRLEVATKYGKRSGSDFIVIEITDTGPGMPRSGIKNIGMSTEKKGRGFGLLITRETLRYYGGHLEIKSVTNSGTTVRLYLPVKQAERTG